MKSNIAAGASRSLKVRLILEEIVRFQWLNVCDMVMLQTGITIKRNVISGNKTKFPKCIEDKIKRVSVF